MSADQEFVQKIVAIIEENISDEKFGVSELADKMNMSRSNLLLKVRKATQQPVTHLIREIRLRRGMELLLSTSKNVSEVADLVGFGSTSYFIKCFRERYGYPPGEAILHGQEQTKEPAPALKGKNRKALLISMGIFVAIVAGALTYALKFSSLAFDQHRAEKSVAVLPFKNDSGDSTNLYLINGLMEATLNNLQRFEDLRVISRTTSEKYRNTSKSAPEMAAELGVNYFVEGSGQRMGDQILLNIQLIDARADRHLWAKQYRREVRDIFDLQREIAENIATEIKVIITPEVKDRIEKKPTNNAEAYDLYLRGRDLFFSNNRDNLFKALDLYNQAIALDPEFALAYADAAMVYYYLDAFQTTKQHNGQLQQYADKALLYDPRLAESLIAKALFYLSNEEYQLAAPYLEKALEYNPNSGMVIGFLSDLYNLYMPNTGKYLAVAIKGVNLERGSTDSVDLGNKYLHLANALVQAGFFDEALTRINTSLRYNPNNSYAEWVKVGVLHTKEHDMVKTRDRLLALYEADTTRVHILQEVAKAYYIVRDYPTALVYYQKLIAFKKKYGLAVFPHADIDIAVTLDHLGRKKEAEAYALSYKATIDKDKSSYKSLITSMYDAWLGDGPKAIQELRDFGQTENFQYWSLLIENDPVVDKIRDLPEFEEVMKELKSKFWESNRQLRIKYPASEIPE